MGAPISLAEERARRRGAVELEPLVTRQQLAEHLLVSDRTIKRYEKAGMPRAVARPVRYRISDCVEWLNGQTDGRTRP